MTAELRRGLVLAILGLLAGLLLVTAFFGNGRPVYDRVAALWRGAPAPEAAAPAPSTPPARPAGDAKAPAVAAQGGTAREPQETRPADPKAAQGPVAATGAPPPAAPNPSDQARGPSPAAGAAPDRGEPGRPAEAARRPDAGPKADAKPPASQTAEAAKPAAPRADPPKAGASPAKPQSPPAFDVIRVEPTGEAVIAGRAAPGATIEVLRGGEPFARGLADPSGLFAIVPPALPKGTSEMSLRSISPDGTRAGSKDTAVIVVPASGTAKPLIALTSPDKPTVVLSQPETAVAARPATEAPGTPPSPPAQTPVKVVSVDAESGGRLFVTAQAPPGATVRLYLNDTLVAPASAGQDGRVSFAIGRGVQAGQYKVRIDQVDPVSAEVRARSEVPFTFPVALAGPLPQTATVMSRSPEAEAESRPRVEDLARSRAPEAAAGASATAPAAPAGGSAPSGSKAPSTVASAPADAASPPRAVQPEGQVYVPQLATLTVSRGDNLWNISRKSYGRGARYTVIYDANQDQIRNPALIYPGQVFVLPQPGAGQEAHKHN